MKSKAWIASLGLGLAVLSGMVAAAEKPLVVVTRFGEEDVDFFRKMAPELEFVMAEEGDDLEQKLATADALVGIKPDLEMLNKAPKLRYVQVTSGGVDTLPMAEMDKRGITLCNMKRLNAPEISEHAMALLLTLAHNTHMAALHKQHQWWDEERDVYARNILLAGKKALIIGVGGIGTMVAEKAAAFGMEVYGIDPKDIPLLRALRGVGKPDELHDYLPGTRVLFICAPLTDKTRGMIGEEELGLLEKGAFLINVTRGQIVDTNAMQEALESGRLAGAGLDVTDPEPLPKDHPLWSIENVVITPHISGRSGESGARERDLIQRNLTRFGKGLPLYNVVDLKKQY